MIVSVKIKATVLMALLSMCLCSKAFAVTGGIDYYLDVFTRSPGSARVTAVITTPKASSSTIPVPPEATFQIPQPSSRVSLGRIEYGVPIGGTAIYKTTFHTDFQTTSPPKFIGCEFILDIEVVDMAFGPQARVTNVTLGPASPSKLCKSSFTLRPTSEVMTIDERQFLRPGR
jgi:hypothetical protein